MAELFCGRIEMCNGCLALQPVEKQTVCKTVAYLAGLPRVETIGESSMFHLGLVRMEETCPSELTVTDELVDIAVQSVDEIIYRKYGLNYG